MTFSQSASQLTWKVMRRKYTSKPPPISYYKAMTNRIQNYYAEIDKRDGETATKERLTIEEKEKK